MSSAEYRSKEMSGDVSGDFAADFSAVNRRETPMQAAPDMSFHNFAHEFVQIIVCAFSHDKLGHGHFARNNRPCDSVGAEEAGNRVGDRC